MNPLLEAIIKASAAGAAQQRGQAAPAADPMAQMLEGILGGGGAAGGRGMPRQAAPAMPQGGPGIEDLIGSLIGGNASQGQPHHNGIADMIGAIMGGGAGGSRNAAVNPIARMLADKLGIPPALAQAAVAFFMTKMFQRQMAPSAPSAPRGGGGGGFMPQRQQEDSLDLDDLLDSMGDSNSLGMRFSNSGMDKELAEKTGMSSDQANKALQEIVNIFGAQREKPNPVTTKGVDLKDLLDAWD